MKQITMKKIAMCFLAILFMLCGLTACNNNPSGTYTVRVATEGGLLLDEIGIKIYTDDTKSDITVAGETDDGVFAFESEGSVGHVVYLEDVPRGYEVAEFYEITSQDMEIVLKSKLLSVEEAKGVTGQSINLCAGLSVGF